MKTAYFDCPSGIAGNMVLGALVDAGLDKNLLLTELKKLRLAHYALRVTKVTKNGLAGTHVEVIPNKKDRPRKLKDILKLIDKSNLDFWVKTQSKKIFMNLGKAESKVHGTSLSDTHFHEIGSTDALVDIIGSVIGLKLLGIKKVYASALPWSIVAPATAELLKGIPIYNVSVGKELVTPTGAAILVTLAEKFESFPRLKVGEIGLGAGSYNLKTPNFLRIIIGEQELFEEDAVLQIETNIDDMNPKLYDRAIARIMKAGALDAYITPIRMKKKRRAIALTALTAPEKKDKVLKAIFDQTTTLGVRMYLVKRKKLRREFKTLGGIKFKIGYLGDEIKTFKPETGLQPASK